MGWTNVELNHLGSDVFYPSRQSERFEHAYSILQKLQWIGIYKRDALGKAFGADPENAPKRKMFIR